MSPSKCDALRHLFAIAIAGRAAGSHGTSLAEPEPRTNVRDTLNY
jgi:hypothetical protein